MIICGDARHPPFINLNAKVIYCDCPSMYGFNGDPKRNVFGYNLFLSSWVKEMPGLMAPDSYLVAFADDKNMQLLKDAITPYLQFKQTIIWHYEFGVYTRKSFVNSHWYILVFTKGKPEFYWERVAIVSQRLAVGDKRADQRGRTPGSVWKINRVQGLNKLRRHAKGPKRSCHPIALATRILRAFCMPGDICFDPFMGTGVVGKACLREGITYVGMDNKFNFCVEAAKRFDIREMIND